MTRSPLPRSGRTLALFVLLMAAGGAAGCGGGSTEPIPRETFIEAYITLRTTALRNETGELDPISRDRILEERGLTVQDLLHFVEVHGRDVPFMGELWEEIDSEVARRLREAFQAEGGVT